MFLEGRIGTAKGLPIDAQRAGVVLWLHEKLPLFPKALSKKYVTIPPNEKGITHELVLFLGNIENHSFFFHHENPENPLDGNSHVCDIAIYVRMKEEDFPRTIYKIEAKRLSRKKFYKSKEYLIGEKSPIKRNGGVERFKILDHGEDQNRCGMFAYVQSESFPYWQTEINTWIANLANDPRITPQWYESEQLQIGNNQPKLATFSSIHLRTNSKNIHLDHFWIDLT